MRFLPVFLFFLLANTVFAQLTLEVTDTGGEPLVGVLIEYNATARRAVTDEAGRYTFPGAAPRRVQLSYPGYTDRTVELPVLATGESRVLPVSLDRALRDDFNELVISAVRANEKLPFTFSEVTREAIEERNLGQDAPFLLRYTPSAVVSSDAGTGIGYTGIRIRGTDPTRINVTINGIPLNDAESQGVFWVNLPDFLSSVENVQIQRGVGTSTNGAGAFGATINLNTNQVQPELYGELAGSIGSFNSRKLSAEFGSGLLAKRFTLEGRASTIQSDGFIDRGSADLRSYYLSGAYIGDRQSLRINVFEGNEVTYQAWNGVPVQYVDDEELRTLNTAGTERPGEPYDNEVDDYGQLHTQLIYDRQLGERWQLGAAAHYTKGSGFFEQYKAAQELAAYGIASPAVPTSDLVRRLWLDNDFYGGLANLKYRPHTRLTATFGTAWNRYEGAHFGEVTQTINAEGVAELPFRYYDNDATKVDFSTFAKANFQLTDDLSAFGDLQYRRVDYDFLGFDRDGQNVTQNAVLNFVNPKAGLYYALTERSGVYASFAVAQREPNRNDYTESSPDSRPRPEKLLNTEVGYRAGGDKWQAEAAAYSMVYRDQLVLTGGINDVGEFTRVNLDRSYRLGLELVGGYAFSKALRADANLTLSRNRVGAFTEFIDNWDTGAQDTRRLLGTPLSFSPDIIGGGSVTLRPFAPRQFAVEWFGKYVGRQYLDNTGTELASLDPYFFSDLRLSYTKDFGVRRPLTVTFDVLVRNLFDARFSSNGWVYRYRSAGYDGRPDDPYTQLEADDVYHLSGRYPQAGRNFLVGVRLRR